MSAAAFANKAWNSCSMGMAADFLRGFYLNPRTYTMSVIQGSLEQSIQRELHQREEEGNAAYWPHAEADMRLFADAFTGATVLYRHDDAVWEIVQAEARGQPLLCRSNQCRGVREGHPEQSKHLPLRAVRIKSKYEASRVCFCAGSAFCSIVVPKAL